MIERIELVGECPIGKLYKRTTVDRFGFIMRVEYIKELRPIFDLYFNNPLCDPQYCYSAYVMYVEPTYDPPADLKPTKTVVAFKAGCA